MLERVCATLAPGMDEVQNIIDSLARRMGLGVAIDDRHLRLIAHSAHVGHVDEVRKTVILTRKAPDEIRDWALSLGIDEATAPVHVPANPSFGLDARVCAPIRCQGFLLGYLWVLEPDPPLDADGLNAMQAAADAAGTVLYRDKLLRDIEMGRERELVRDLLSEGPDLQRHAANELVEADLFAPGSPIAALVVRPVHARNRQPDETVRLSMGSAVDRARRNASPRRQLHLVRPDHALMIVTPNDPRLMPGGLTSFAREVHDSLAESLGEEWSVVAGIGDSQPSLSDAIVSYGQAQKTVHVASIVRSFGDVVSWSDLGIYQMLCEFPMEQITAGALPAGLRRVLDHAGADTLVSTLECYLDLSGDAKAVTAAMGLHRGTLYYRLRKIEEIAGVSLRNGDDRLAMHLGLKLARLAGLLPLAPRTESAAGARPSGIGT